MDDFFTLWHELRHPDPLLSRKRHYLTGCCLTLKTSHPCHDPVGKAGGGVKVRETLQRLLDSGELFR